MAYEHFVRTVLESLMKELMDTASLEVQPWLELLVKAYITKAAGKPSKLDDGVHWKLCIEAAKQKLQKLPKLKQALGNDTYIRLIERGSGCGQGSSPLAVKTQEERGHKRRRA